MTYVPPIALKRRNGSRRRSSSYRTDPCIVALRASEGRQWLNHSIGMGVPCVGLSCIGVPLELHGGEMVAMGETCHNQSLPMGCLEGLPGPP